MAEESPKNRLGRGLAALIGEMDKPVAGHTDPASAGAQPNVPGDRTVPIESICANANNPRQDFTASELDDLASSISEHGVLQPILVRPIKDDPIGIRSVQWEIIAGERRWRAAQKAGVHTVPVVVRDVDDRQALELAIIENVQRSDLNPVEEAAGYQQLIDDYHYSQADLGKVIGKSRSHVANTLRLLNLPPDVQQLLSSGKLTAGHARALIPLDAPQKLARRIVEEGLSVRQAEHLASLASQPVDPKDGRPASREKDANTLALEQRISDALGLKVSIHHKPNGKGRLVIDYQSLDQLDGLESKLIS